MGLISVCYTPNHIQATVLRPHTRLLLQDSNHRPAPRTPSLGTQPLLKGKALVDAKLLKEYNLQAIRSTY
jgi:hypothetical protein